MTTDHVSEPVLQMTDVVRIHGRGDAAVHALRGLDLSIDAGELVAVMGPSGSGKSTLLNLAGGLDQATAGSIRVGGVELGSLTARELAALRRRRIGYVFQDLNLIPSLTAVENVTLPLELDGTKTRDARTQALRTLSEVGLDGLDSRFPDELSGGQQQRVAIARSIVGARTLVLADEPTGALDSETGEQVVGLLRERCAGGVGALLVTHDARYASWADRIVFLRDGVAVDDTGRPTGVESLLTSPT